jgi:hypothetical protein
MRIADRTAFIIIAGICGYFWIQSMSFGRYGVLFPRVIILILGVLSCVLLAASFFEPKDRKIFGGKTVRYAFILLLIFLLIAWIALIRYIGFVVSSIVFISLLNVLIDRRRRKPGAVAVKVAVTAAIVGAFYLFFSRLLLVSFPKGLLF